MIGQLIGMGVQAASKGKEKKGAEGGEEQKKQKKSPPQEPKDMQYLK